MGAVDRAMEDHPIVGMRGVIRAAEVEGPIGIICRYRASVVRKEANSRIRSHHRRTVRVCERPRTRTSVSSDRNSRSGSHFTHPFDSVCLADLCKYDTPLTGAKINRMLVLLEFKLSVETQYKQGIEKMAKLYQVECVTALFD